MGRISVLPLTKKSIQSSTTPAPGYQWKSSKITINITNKSQEVSPFPSGDHKAAVNRRESMTTTQMIHKIITALERSVKYFTGGLKPVSQRVNLTLSSDVDQDK